MDERRESESRNTTLATPSEERETVVIPKVEENLRVGKRKRETGRVRVQKKVVPEEVHRKESLTEETVHVDRVARNAVLNERPEVRVEGDTTIIPIVDEIIEVSKKFVLREELHVRKEKRVVTQDVTGTIHHDVVTVDRLGPSEPELDPSNGG